MDLPELELKPWHYVVALALLLFLLLAFVPPAEKPQATPSPSPAQFVKNAQNYSGQTFSYSQQIVTDGRNAKSTFSLTNFRDIRLGLADVIPAKFAKSVNNISLETIPPISTKTLDFYPLIQYSSFNASKLSRSVSSNDADANAAPLHLLVPADLTEEQQQTLGGILRRLAFMELTADERSAIQKKWNELFDRSIAQNVSADSFLDAAEKLVDKIEELKTRIVVPSPIASAAASASPSVTTSTTPSAAASVSPSAKPSASALATVSPTPIASVLPTPVPSPRPLSQQEIEDIEIDFPKNASSLFPDLPEEIILNVSENAPFDVKNYSLNYSSALGTPLLRVVGSAYKYASARVSTDKKLVVDAFVDAALNENGLFPFDSVTGEVRLAFSSAVEQEFKIPLKIVVEHTPNPTNPEDVTDGDSSLPSTSVWPSNPLVSQGSCSADAQKLITVARSYVGIEVSSSGQVCQGLGSKSCACFVSNMVRQAGFYSALGNVMNPNMVCRIYQAASANGAVEIDSIGEMIPGDLVLMKTYAGICEDNRFTHIGIYVGNNVMIDSGHPVRERTVFKFVKGLRFLPSCISNSQQQPQPTSVTLSGKVIALEAGHGVGTGGCLVGAENEADYNQNVALKLKALIENAGGSVVMTRNLDCSGGQEANLRGRAETANAANADLAIDIHFDAVQGTKAFVYCNSGACSDYHAECDVSCSANANSKRLAEKVYARMTALVGTDGARMKGMNLYFLQYLNMPGMLVEVDGAAVSHSSDPAFRQQVAQALYQAILDYYGS